VHNAGRYAIVVVRIAEKIIFTTHIKHLEEDMDIPFDNTGVSIETSRLIIRPFTEVDLSDFFEYASVPGVGEMAGWPHHTSIETTRTRLQTHMENKDTFAMYCKADDKVIGSLGLHES